MWTPNEIRKLIAQLSGILFGIGGIALMVAGVKATGKINISSNFISGEIESGSAGLLLLFLSFFLIVIPSLRTKYVGIQSENETKSKEKKTNDFTKLIVTAIVGTILTFTFFIGGQHLADKYKFTIGTFMFFVGYVVGVITGFVMLSIGYYYLTGEPINDNKPSEKIDPNTVK